MKKYTKILGVFAMAGFTLGAKTSPSAVTKQPDFDRLCREARAEMEYNRNEILALYKFLNKRRLSPASRAAAVGQINLNLTNQPRLLMDISRKCGADI